VVGRSRRPYDAVYSVTKWGGDQYYAKCGIVSCTLQHQCECCVPTPIWDNIDKVQGVQRQGLHVGEWMQKSIEAIPLKRVATSGDIAAAVSFLASEDADYITGQSLNVDGGIEMN
jgi:NAD(P)-dependent dehydrogenase (short-subunit alcohol dehydrogenase family)